MQNDNRGQINHINRFRQGSNFSELRYGNITPSDIDLVLEIHDKKWIFGELKMEGVDLSLGQRLVLERAAIVCGMAKKQVIAFLAAHNVTDCSQDIDVSKAFVTEMCIGEYETDCYGNRHGTWHKVDYSLTVKELCDSFIEGNNSPFDIAYRL